MTATPGPATALFLHGFTGRATDQTALASALATRGWRPSGWLLPDLPGHGGQAFPPGRRLSPDLDGLEAQLADAPAPQTTFAYSLGGRLALTALLAPPSTWPPGARPTLAAVARALAPTEHLVLISTTAGLQDEAERRDRRAQDAALAQRIRRDGLDAFLAFWRQQPLIRTQQDAPLVVRQALTRSRQAHTARGLASALERYGQGVLPSTWAALGALRGRSVTVLVGADDHRYRSIGARLAEATGGSLIVVPGAGHAPHLEAPEATADALLDGGALLGAGLSSAAPTGAGPISAGRPPDGAPGEADDADR
jgi:2-succinyl-6-hydroxy-2,4-cyclohexadiene-1-carboxylate synthase